MRQASLPPRAASLSESLRDLGYSLESAVADIIDNSISAKAKTIDIWCDAESDNPCLAIVDDGCGMGEDELIESMRYGSKNPKDVRSKTDLGRFGLGLKTASFSQCRKLTVISRKDGDAGVLWDLDVLAHDEWLIGILNKSEIRKTPWYERLPKSGTIVLWEQMDRLIEGQNAGSASAILSEKLTQLTHHLSLVFHRHLTGEIGKTGKITIRVNGHLIEGFDPFCRRNKATQPLPVQSVRINNSAVVIQPFILPHHSKLTRKEFDFYKDRSDFLSNQGAYVYRNGRLMAWGDWFRLVPKGESTKLARVQIDFPTDLDEMWTIDIKKSRAHPPAVVREQLKQIIGRITDQSSRVHTGRSRKLFEKDVMPMWTRYAERSVVRYAPNEDHPIFAAFERSLPEKERARFRSILETIGASIPVEAIYSDYSGAPKDIEQKPDTPDPKLALAKLSQLRLIVDPEKKMTGDQFRRIIRSTRLFEGAEAIIDDFIMKDIKSGETTGV